MNPRRRDLSHHFLHDSFHGSLPGGLDPFHGSLHDSFHGSLPGGLDPFHGSLHDCPRLP